MEPRIIAKLINSDHVVQHYLKIELFHTKETYTREIKKADKGI